MRVVTLNTWKNDGDYAARLPLMVEGLRALRADVICLQECFEGGGDDTALALAKGLGRCASLAVARRKRRRHGGAQVMSSSGLAVLTRGAPLAAAVLDLPPDMRDGERLALRVDIPGLRVLNLHLTHLRDDEARAWRARQLEVALAWAADGWDEALLVCGDLNMTRDDPAFAPLAATAGGELGSTLHGAGPPCAIDHIVLLKPGGLRIAETRLALRAADAEGRHPSDHAAVVADLTAPD